MNVTLLSIQAVGIGGDRWPAAEMFCKTISDSRWESFFRLIFNDKKVIELGAGTGLVAIIVEKLFSPKSVIVTDLDSHLPLIKDNLRLNSTKYCETMPLDWTRTDYMGSNDVILVLECVYNEDLYLPLIHTLDRICLENSIIFLGLTRLFAKQKFFALLTESGFKYTMIPERSLPEQYADEFSDRDVGLFVVTRHICTKLHS